MRFKDAAYEILKQKGKLIVSVPNPTNLNFILMDWLKMSDTEGVKKIGKLYTTFWHFIYILFEVACQ